MSDLDKYLSEAGKRLQRETDREVRSAKWTTSRAFNKLFDRLNPRVIVTYFDGSVYVRMMGGGGGGGVDKTNT